MQGLRTRACARSAYRWHCDDDARPHQQAEAAVVARGDLGVRMRIPMAVDLWAPASHTRARAYEFKAALRTRARTRVPGPNPPPKAPLACTAATSATSATSGSPGSAGTAAFSLGEGRVGKSPSLHMPVRLYSPLTSLLFSLSLSLCLSSVSLLSPSIPSPLSVLSSLSSLPSSPPLPSSLPSVRCLRTRRATSAGARAAAAAAAATGRRRARRASDAIDRKHVDSGLFGMCASLALLCLRPERRPQPMLQGAGKEKEGGMGARVALVERGR